MKLNEILGQASFASDTELNRYQAIFKDDSVQFFRSIYDLQRLSLKVMTLRIYQEILRTR